MLKIFLSLLILSSIFIFSPQTASATTIFSPVVELEVNPGESNSGVVKVYNETDKDLVLVSSIETFETDSQAGQPEYIPQDFKNEYLKWFELEEPEITLKPNQIAIIPFTVTVPEDVIPGGYYSVISWEATQESNLETSGVGVKSKVGTLVLLKVNGDIIEDGRVVSFIKKPNKNFYFNLPINFSIQFENSGNIHLQPSGQVVLKNWFGKTESLKINQQARSVLPNSSKTFDISWGQVKSGSFIGDFLSGLKQETNSLAFGKYTATLNLDYGVVSKQFVSQSVSFWILPYRLFVTFIVLIFILMILFKVNKVVNKLKKSAKKKV